MMPQNPHGGYQPLSAFRLQVTNDFHPRQAPTKAPNEPMKKETAIFIPGQGSIPGTQQPAPQYNNTLGHGFTMQRENDFTSAPAQPPKQIASMNVNVASFVPQNKQ